MSRLHLGVLTKKLLHTKGTGKEMKVQTVKRCTINLEAEGITDETGI
jgi:hypothetical protein